MNGRYGINVRPAPPKNTPQTTETPVLTQYTEERLYSTLFARKARGGTLRKIAASFGEDVSYSIIQKILQGQFPASLHIRKALGLGSNARVTALGDIEPGALAMASRECSQCARPFIPNHGLRRKCFICSPYKAYKGK